jgi:anti-anti-sigma factor
MNGADTPATFVFGEKIWAGNIESLEELLEPLFADPASARVVFDLDRVRLCDSSGLRLLLNFQRRAAASGKSLVLYRPDHILKDLLIATKLYHVFNVVDDLDQTAPSR